MRKDIGIALLGYAFMGRAHSTAYRHVQQHFNTRLRPRMKVLAGRTEAPLRAAAEQLGWEECETDWRRAIERDDVAIVDVSTPGWAHKEQVIAAARAGKHIICEKPIANTLREAKAMVAAVRRASGGIRHIVMHNYRRIPAVALARKIIDQDEIGRIFHFRAFYQQDWIVDPAFPLVWRLEKDKAGSGALGDIGSHIIDYGRYLVGEIASVQAHLATFIPERPLPGAETKRKSKRTAAGAKIETPMGKVTVDDAAVFIAKFQNGAIGTFEATRFAQGRKNWHGFEIYGERGSLAFNFESMNELWHFDAREGRERQGFKRILVTEPVHPYMSNWWPPGHLIGYEHTFANTIADFLDAIESGAPMQPDLVEGLRNQAVLDAVERSARAGRWAAVEVVE